MSILLVRHGETAGNAGRVLQRAEIPLNERGLRQAELLSERLCGLGFAHVLCSDLQRARMTAAPLLARSGLRVEETPLLQERNFGDLRGTPYDQLPEDPFAPDFVPPGGESWDAFHDRVAAAFALISARRRSLDGHLVVVTHGLVCRAILQRHAQLGSGHSTPDRYDNTSVTVLDPEPPHATRLINCTEHLSPELAPGRIGGAA
jgi:probable phosphoglycerate mutase